MKIEAIRSMALLLACAAVLVLTPTVTASPIFSVGEGGTQSWTDALNTGRIVPVNGPLTFAAQQFYNNQIGQPIPNTANFVTGVEVVAPTLVPDVNVSDGQEQHQSLAMTWDHPADPNALGVASWDYVYGQDPNLSNVTIKFSVFAPPGVWDLSIELIDSLGRSRGWFQGMPPNVWTNYTLNPNGGLQAPFNTFINQPGFDITQVVAIRLNESGVFSMPFAPNPINGQLGWNAWNSLQTTPEPSTYLLFAVGLLGIVGMGYRQRKKAA